MCTITLLVRILGPLAPSRGRRWKLLRNRFTVGICIYIYIYVCIRKRMIRHYSYSTQWACTAALQWLHAQIHIGEVHRKWRCRHVYEMCTSDEWFEQQPYGDAYFIAYLYWFRIGNASFIIRISERRAWWRRVRGNATIAVLRSLQIHLAHPPVRTIHSATYNIIIYIIYIYIYIYITWRVEYWRVYKANQR